MAVKKRYCDIDVAHAIEQQRRLAGQVVETPLEGEIRVIAGADATFSQDEKFCIAAVISFSWPDLEVINKVVAVKTLDFPYIPGLLSFREAPAVVAAGRKLPQKPDILLIDGQGRAHPRRFGLASHVGLELGWPTIGCAKSRLIGENRAVGRRKGCQCRLTDKGELIGKVVRSRDEVKCLYVSVGHLVGLDEAVRIVLRCCRKYRLPEPTRQAHILVSQIRQKVGMDNRFDMW
jgi:deoxyribonuclease V